MRVLALLLLLSSASLTAQAQQTAAPPSLDSYVQSVLAEFKVPGLSLAIVKDGNVVVARGYGVRDLATRTEVDDRTVFGIASNSKIFTATSLALLAEEGKVDWNAPVTRYLPWFAMYDPYVTREITVKDLLVHRSGLGLGAGDLLWWPESTYSRREIVRRLRFIPPATSFRSGYAYDNVLYTVAGMVIESVSGLSWEDFVTRRILRPAGMTDSNVRHSLAGVGSNAAAPHASVDGTVRKIEPMRGDNVNPAGGLNSSAHDMARWMILQLDSGKLAGGKRLYESSSTKQLWTLVTPIPEAEPPPALSFMRAVSPGYALGLFVRDYRGQQMMYHTGTLPGYVSKVTMIPALRLGVAVLTNQESSAAYNAIIYRIVDYYLGAQAPDYIKLFSKMENAAFASGESVESSGEQARDRTSRASLPLSRYARVYKDRWYGDVTIREENRKLTIRFNHTPSLEGDLAHWEGDTFVARWRDRSLRADAYVRFKLAGDGRSVASVTMSAVSPLTDFSFDFQDLLLVPLK